MTGPLKLLGVEPFRACLEEKLLLAKYFHAEVQKLGFESKIEPELSVAADCRSCWERTRATAQAATSARLGLELHAYFVRLRAHNKFVMGLANQKRPTRSRE